MSTNALQKLTIECLRGSVSPFSLPFEKGKKLTVIYGENATGKSTICDALEFLGKGNVGSLDNRGLGRTTRYWHSLGKKAGDISVSLEAENTLCTGTLQKGGVVCLPADSQPRVEVLRRSQILSLLEATPADRYEAIRRFIDLSGVESSEASLNQLIHDLTGSREVALARVEENRAAIQQFWESTDKSTDPLVWAEEESKRDASASDAEVAALIGLHTAYSRLTDYPARLETADQSQESARKAVAVANSDVDKCVETIAKDAGEVMNLLEAARIYLLRNPSPTVCPLCESSDKATDLAKRVTERLTSFASLQTAQSKKKGTDAALQRAEQQRALLTESAKTHAAEFDNCLKNFKWSSDVKLPKSSVPGEISKLVAWLDNTAELPGEWKKAENARQDKKHFLDTLKRALTTWNENVTAQKELDQLLPKLEKTLEIVKEERRKFSDNILSKIAKEVGRIYDAVHPDEGLNKISLELDPGRRASLEITASFLGSNSPPQAYFSDSHLDTLGLCVFLALTTLDKPDETILVLDDVLASVDEPHVDRLIETLYAEAEKFRHCLITTHYKPWKNKLQWGWLKTGQVQFVELNKWSDLDGLSTIQTIPDIEKLRSFLAEVPPDVQTVCAKAGYILEAALNFLTLQYECPCPRKPEGRYTLRDYLQAISKKLRDALRVEVVTVGADGSAIVIEKDMKLGPILNEIERIAEARNAFGCHFKDLTFEHLDQDGLSFGRQVLALMDALTDQKAGWPKKAKTDHWTTGDNTRRLYPLRRP